MTELIELTPLNKVNYFIDKWDKEDEESNDEFFLRDLFSKLEVNINRIKKDPNLKKKTFQILASNKLEFLFADFEDWNKVRNLIKNVGLSINDLQLTEKSKGFDSMLIVLKIEEVERERKLRTLDPWVPGWSR